MSSEFQSLAIIATFFAILVIFFAIGIRCSYTCYKKSIRKSEGLLLDRPEISLTPRSSNPEVIRVSGVPPPITVKVIPNFYAPNPAENPDEASSSPVGLVRSHSPTHTFAYIHSQLPTDSEFQRRPS